MPLLSDLSFIAVHETHNPFLLFVIIFLNPSYFTTLSFLLMPPLSFDLLFLPSKPSSNIPALHIWDAPVMVRSQFSHEKHPHPPHPKKIPVKFKKKQQKKKHDLTLPL